MVSEIMLQQTQVDRVVPFYRAFVKKFPTVQSLAAASLSDVLVSWQGLGYNRRGKMLREAARVIVERHRGVVPKDRAALESLPGIGPYTAGAIRAFAFDEPDVFIETNIRAALIHHLFPRSRKVADDRLMPILRKLLDGVPSSREWYSALMDYGAHLKATHPNPSRRSAHHTRQSAFEGSLRQARGVVLRSLAERPRTRNFFAAVPRGDEALSGLVADGMVASSGGRWRLAD